MLSVEFRSVGPGACGFCRKERGDVYTVAFGDRSFVGALCRSDLMKAIGMKFGGESPQKPGLAAVPVNNGPAK